jgi:Fe-S-cluster-containing dehydrogenase component
MTRWAMVADLNRCVGCQTCTTACKHANATAPGVQWRRVLDIEAGEFPDVRRAFVPVGCMHCDEPACVEVCPSTASRRRDDGIVTIDYDLCIGCAYCAVACPYQARFKVEQPRYAYDSRQMAHERAREVPRTASACRRNAPSASSASMTAPPRGSRPGRDPEATPACVASCIADALHFGDLDDPASNVSRLLDDNSHFRMHDELGTGPGIYYLWNRHPNGQNGSGPGAISEPSDEGMQAIAPWLQNSWDWRAASNFMAGGAGSGLLVMTGLAALAGLQLWLMSLAGLGLIAAGLLAVWHEIGRPWRFLNVLRAARSSWMTREAMVAGLLFATGFAAVMLAPSPAAVGLTLAAAALALGFLYCQARILQASKGIPAWREQAIVPVIVVTGLAEGAGLFVAASVLLPQAAPSVGPAALALVVLLMARLITWHLYLMALRARGAPTRSLIALERLQPSYEIGGHLVAGASPRRRLAAARLSRARLRSRRCRCVRRRLGVQAHAGHSGRLHARLCRRPHAGPRGRDGRSRSQAWVDSRPICATLSVRPVRGAARGPGAAARLLRDDRQGDRRRLHARRHGAVDRPDGAVHRLRRRPAWRYPAQRLRLRPVHRRARRALRRGKARLHGRAGVRRHDRAAGDCCSRISVRMCSAPRRPMRSTSPRSPKPMGVDLRKLPLRLGLFGAEPWSDAMRRDLEARLGIKAVDLYGLSEIIGPGRGDRMPRRAGRPAWLGGPFPVRGDRSEDARTGAGRRAGRTGRHHADQAGAADDPLPHPRHHAAHRAPCTCGRTHVRIMRVTGRDDDMMIIRGVNVYPSQIEAVLVGRIRASRRTTRSR